jgi:hypothetical protein
MKTDQIAKEMVDREAIRDCLYRYCRGVDRWDKDMLRTAYWQDAVDDHGAYCGDREGLIAWLEPLVTAMENTQHMVGNILIRLHGDRADVESYFLGYHRYDSGTAVVDSIMSGRYLDRLEQREGEWRIAKRKVIIDWFRDYDDTGDWQIGPMGIPNMPRGSHYPRDDSFSLLDIH